MLKKLSINSRLMLFMPVLLLTLVGSMWFGLTQLRHSLLNDRKDESLQLVQQATSHREHLVRAAEIRRAHARSRRRRARASSSRRCASGATTRATSSSSAMTA